MSGVGVGVGGTESGSPLRLKSSSFETAFGLLRMRI
jgi:hypothetical protein